MPKQLPKNLPEHLLNIHNAAAFLGLSVSSLRGHITNKRIAPLPETRGAGNRNLFDAADLKRLKDELAAYHEARHKNQIVVDGCKPCTKCSQVLPISAFEVAPARFCGHQSWCKQCSYESRKLWRHLHPDKCRQYAHKWEKANPEKAAAIDKRSHERCREKRIAYFRAWYRVNADYCCAYNKAKRRAQNENKPTHFLRFLVQLCDRKQCPKCGRIRSLLEFDRDGRRVDGYSKWCLDCLPPRKLPWMHSLDQSPGGDVPNIHESVADRRAVDPEQAAVEAAMQTELWAFVDSLPPKKRGFLLAYMDFLDLEKAASEVGIPASEAGQWLASIRQTAASAFETDETDTTGAFQQ